MGLGCDIIPEVKYDGVPVSSTIIRDMLLAGDVEQANKFLGHSHILSDIVRYGFRLGSKLGTPTINMLFQDGVLVPAHGVYATKVFIEPSHSALIGVTNVGARPTVDNSGKITAETHILNYRGNLYGRKVRIEFHEYLRSEIKFAGLDELKAQIQKDCISAGAFFDNVLEL
jgi:riboflavin kinase/FMN adenylyltransferase